MDSTFTGALVTGQSVTDVPKSVFATVGWDEVRLAALEEALASGARTPDLGGTSSTEEVTQAVITHLVPPDKK